VAGIGVVHVHPIGAQALDHPPHPGAVEIPPTQEVVAVVTHDA